MLILVQLIIAPFLVGVFTSVIFQKFTDLKWVINLPSLLGSIAFVILFYLEEINRFDGIASLSYFLFLIMVTFFLIGNVLTNIIISKANNKKKSKQIRLKDMKRKK